MSKKIVYAALSMLFVFSTVFSIALICRQRNDKSKYSGSPSGSSHVVSRSSRAPESSSAPQASSAPLIAQNAPQSESVPDKNHKTAYLTFDDGPSRNTAKVLNVLKSKNVKATFFVVGKQDSQSGSMLKRMVNEGHAIGIHSWSHQYSLIYNSEADFLDDFNRIRNYIYDVTGVKSEICRFPGGLNNRVCLKYGGHIMSQLYQDVTAMGVKVFDWNVAAHDACEVPPSKELIVYNVLSGCAGRNNAVILLHDTNLTTTTLEALPEIIDRLSDKGYTFAVLSPTSPTVLFKPV